VPIRALSFDLFDTLVDLSWDELPPRRVEGLEVGPTTPALHAALRAEGGPPFAEFVAALRAVDRGIRHERYAVGREVSSRERFAALLRALGREDEGLARRLARIHMRGLRSQVRPVGHHAALLRSLGGRFRLGLCSNFTDGETALGVLEETGLRELLDALAISVDVGWRKPRREIFDALVAGLGAAPAETLHVGDNLDADVAGAAAAGLRTAWLTRRVADPAGARARHAGPPPDFVLADLAELPALLERAA
jgi:putative hydrolase of the HAD superfamily